jgi:hypothetical protein
VIDPVDLSLRLIGAFYVFAGLAAARAQLMGRLIDKAIAAISLKPVPRAERLQSVWWLSASVVIFAGGIALLCLHQSASWLFVVSALGQAIYFAALAPLYFDKADPPDEAGRRRSINAFVLYAAATAYVIWADATGHLTALTDASPISLAIAATASLGFLFYVGKNVLGWTGRRKSTPSDEPVFDDEEFSPARNPADSISIKLMADYDCDPLWAMDDGYSGCFPPEDIGLSNDLCRDLKIWSDAFSAALDRDDPSNSLWTIEQRQQHQKEERLLAQRIANERPERRVHIVDHDTLDLILVEPVKTT